MVNLSIFLGSEWPKFRPCHIVYFIKQRSKKYFKVTDVDRNEPRLDGSTATQR